MRTKEEIRTFLRQKDADGISVYRGGRYETTVKYDEDDVIRALSDFAAQSVREDRESRWISASNPPVIPDGDDFVRLLLRANGHVLFGKYERDEDTGECHYIEVDSSQGSMDLCDHATHYHLLPH